jgi:hypothetical protein
VVVTVGPTVVEPLAAAEVNVPGVMAMLVAPVAAQLNALLLPEFMLAGAALKDVMTGTAPLPVGGFANVAAVHPAIAAHASRVSANTQRFNPEEITSRVMDSFLQCKPGKPMRNSFL